MNKIRVLDCTLRDGGYINDWNFGEKNIIRIINHLTEAKLEIIECGFLSNKNPYNRNKSIFDSLNRIAEYIPKDRWKSKYVCMINYGEYDIDDIPEFDGKSIDGIRVVFHKKDVKEAINFCEKLSKKGYMLFIQPMVTINYSDIELLKLVEEVNKIKPYAFYIVDSFGVMKKNDLLRMFYLIDNNLNKNINVGYHSHNNLQLAYSNAQSLVEIDTNRIRIIDSSVFGMGRGAGNLNTELFIQHINEHMDGNYKIYPLLTIIDEVLNNIYSKNYWGYSLPYYLSSTFNCHPNYASYLSEKNTLTVKSINEILDIIENGKKDEFDKNYVEELYLDYQRNYIDDKECVENLKKIFANKNIVVIAPGSSIDKYYEKVRNVVEEKDTIVISVNFVSRKFNCDFVFVSNEKRFNRIVENKKIDKEKTNLIVTSNISFTNDNIININYNNLINNISSVRDNATLMLLKLLVNLNIKKILLAGFDGYSYDEVNNYVDEDMILATSRDTMQKLNEGVAIVLTRLCKDIDIEFITPTRYFDYVNNI